VAGFAARFPVAIMLSILLVFLGAGLGGVLRHAAGLAALRLAGPGFPWGTLAVNIVGCLVMGVLAAGLAAHRTEARLLLMTGVLGGFTTFSAFSLDAVLLWQRGEALAAGLYVLGSVALSLAALILGLALGRALA
jgi:CrcB protein